MSAGGYGSRDPAAGRAAAGLDQVRLSYHLLQVGDADGYASLFEGNAVLRAPGTGSIVGRAAIERAATAGGVQIPHHLFATDRHVTVTGRHLARPGTDIGFAEIFTISEQGLLVTKTTYFYTSPYHTG
ncbi:nuclear transport factor 2 family protein [Labedaea rhizosphaerae]|uniref:Uncharacterized protein n=1 Tax=Labedaea rhizosphaerae TaxID=598644 RepID=A0A4R6RUK2_LABRH|nr:nuclear transport factor 2 family protein [Labedaea rhizosphaerae]TDP90631.1 hypothetical protein EV186_110172 [Labedaea rhizosphaerae]